MGKILLVDDDDQLRSAIAEILENEGYEVWEVATIKEAVQCFDSTISLLICDIVLPEENGIEFITKVKAHYSRLPIIAISGGVSGAYSEHYLKSAELLGASAVLKKPFRFEDLIEQVKSLLK